MIVKKPKNYKAMLKALTKHYGEQFEDKTNVITVQYLGEVDFWHKFFVLHEIDGKLAVCIDCVFRQYNEWVVDSDTTYIDFETFKALKQINMENLELLYAK